MAAQMTHHDGIFLLFGLCLVANIWNKNPVFVYRRLQYYQWCTLFWVCLRSTLTKDDWAPFWIRRHFNFHAYSIVIQSWASAETMLVKVPHIKMALWYAFLPKKSSCNSNWCVCIKHICVCVRESVYIYIQGHSNKIMGTDKLFEYLSLCIWKFWTCNQQFLCLPTVLV